MIAQSFPQFNSRAQNEKNPSFLSNIIDFIASFEYNIYSIRGIMHGGIHMKRGSGIKMNTMLQAMHHTGIVQFSARLCTSIWA
jgi:hypothetical protein